MKTCSICKTSKENILFYNTTQGSLFPYCRVCSNAKSKIWQQTNKHKKNQGNKLWRERNTDRIKIMKTASNLIAKYIKSGQLNRATICQQCGNDQYTEAAHSCYSRPLDVIWLCKSCHRKWDSYDPKSNRANLFIEL